MEKIVGMALPTVAIMIAFFMLGMSIGALVFSQSWFKPQSAGQLYFINQCLLFLYGLAFVGTQGLKFLGHLSAENQSGLSLIYLARLLAIAIFLLIPAILIGAGLPLLLRLSLDNQLDSDAQKLYRYNLLGSIIGALLAGFVLVPNFGIAKSTIFAALVQLLAGLLILVVSRLLHDQHQSLVHTAVNPTSSGPGASISIHTLPSPAAIFTLVIGAAFFNMLLELLFIRFYGLIIGSSLHSYALILAIQLTALASGAYWVAKHPVDKEDLSGSSLQIWIDRLVYIYMLSAGWLIFILYFLSPLPLLFITFRYICQLAFAIPANIAFMLSGTIIALSTMFMPAFCLGTILPGYFRARQMNSSLPEPSQMYAANLIGTLSGCLLGGTIMFPALNLFSNHAIQLAFELVVAAIFGTACLIHILLYCPHRSMPDKNTLISSKKKQIGPLSSHLHLINNPCFAFYRPSTQLERGDFNSWFIIYAG